MVIHLFISVPVMISSGKFIFSISRLTSRLSSVLLSHGADGCLTNGDGLTVFSNYLKSVPNECVTILSSFMEKNRYSLAAQNLEIKISFQLWEKEWRKTESDGLLR